MSILIGSVTVDPGSNRATLNMPSGFDTVTAIRISNYGDFIAQLNNVNSLWTSSEILHAQTQMVFRSPNVSAPITITLLTPYPTGVGTAPTLAQIAAAVVIEASDDPEQDFTGTYPYPLANGGSADGGPAFPMPSDIGTTVGVPNGTTLTPFVGQYLVNTDNAVVENMNIQGQLLIRASNVTVRNCLIQTAGAPGSGTIICQFGTNADRTDGIINGLIMENCEISRPVGSTGNADYGLELYCFNITMRGVLIRNVTSGISLQNAKQTLDMQGCLIMDLVNISGSDHCDGIIADGGVQDCLITGNTILNPLPQTTCIALFPDGAPNANMAIVGNLLAGGGYVVYPNYTKGSESPNTVIMFSNNVFSRMYYPDGGSFGAVDQGSGGASFFDGVGNIWSGNTWQDTGLPVLPTDG